MKTLYIVIFLFTLSVPATAQFGLPKFPRSRKPIVEKDPDVRSVSARLISGEHNELTTKGILQGRNMANYEQGGHYDCSDWAPPDDPRGTCDQKKVRDFIWEHWSERKRGYVRMTHGTIDALATSHIFLEPGTRGEWRIVWRIARLSMLIGGRRELADMLGRYTVERVEVKGLDDWCIVIKRRSGEIFARFPGNSI